VLGHAGEEFFKTLSRFRRGGDDELSVHHCKVYLRAQVINYGFITILPGKDMSNFWQ